MRILLAAVLAVLLAACSTYQRYGLKPGASTAADVQRSMGAPAMEFNNPDGSRQLAYTTSPLGTETFMVFVDRDGILERIDQVLTDDQFYRIHAGRTSRQEVQKMIGPPWRIVRFDNLKQDAWDYHYRDSWGYLCYVSVMMDDQGMVAGKVIQRIESGRDRAGR